MSSILRDTLKRAVRPFLSKYARDAIRSIYYFPVDAKQALFGKDDLLPPPSKTISTGTADFKGSGIRDLGYLREYVDLKPSDRFLDIGCGYGRLAAPLLEYLDDKSIYEGLDIVPEEIKWCRSRISTKRPSFRFTLADIYNRSYNPDGSQRASEYRLPYDDESFEVAFAFSVFTHMLADEAENYIREIGRVLAPGGRAYLTFFVLDETSRDLIEQKKSSYDFKYHHEGYSLVDQAAPDYAIAFDEEVIKLWYNQGGMDVIDIKYGGWSGRTKDILGQDAVIAVKRP